jgi:hypothetical protein
VTREGMGTNFGLLAFDRSDAKTPAAVVSRRFHGMVKELRTALETRQGDAREPMIDLLGRVINYYQHAREPALLEAARAVAQAVTARMEDDKEVVDVRLHAMNLWTTIQAIEPRRPPGSASSRPAPTALQDELQARALWIAPLCNALNSSVTVLQYRAGEILIDALKDSDATPAFRAGWRKGVHSLAGALTNKDLKVRHGALAILSLLGPEALEALAPLRSLAHDTQDAAMRLAALTTIKSISCADDLTNDDPAIRVASAEMIGRLGWRATSAVPALIDRLTDSETKVRYAAVSALRSLGDVSDSKPLRP